MDFDTKYRPQPIYVFYKLEYKHISTTELRHVDTRSLRGGRDRDDEPAQRVYFNIGGGYNPRDPVSLNSIPRHWRQQNNDDEDSPKTDYRLDYKNPLDCNRFRYHPATGCITVYGFHCPNCGVKAYVDVSVDHLQEVTNPPNEWKNWPTELKPLFTRVKCRCPATMTLLSVGFRQLLIMKERQEEYARLSIYDRGPSPKPTDRRPPPLQPARSPQERAVVMPRLQHQTW